jgi:hypothetical protein
MEMEQIKIEIESAEVVIKSGIAAKTGKPYSIREQKGWAYLLAADGKPQRHPVTFKVSLRDDQNPYAPGNYTLSLSSIYTNKFDQFEVSPMLVAAPVAVAVKAA